MIEPLALGNPHVKVRLGHYFGHAALQQAGLEDFRPGQVQPASALEHGPPRFESCHRLAKLAANRPGLATHSPERYSMLGVHAEADWEARSYTERFMAQRAHATTVEVDSSHVAMISQPEATTRLILAAADSIR